MSRLSFATFFQSATGNTPYDYQRRLACGDQTNRAEVVGTTCQSQLINIPTGLGKTAAFVLAWPCRATLRRRPAVRVPPRQTTSARSAPACRAA
jgi:hypothetical protein